MNTSEVNCDDTLPKNTLNSTIEHTILQDIKEDIDENSIVLFNDKTLPQFVEDTDDNETAFEISARNVNSIGLEIPYNSTLNAIIREPSDVINEPVDTLSDRYEETADKVKQNKDELLMNEKVINDIPTLYKYVNEIYGEMKKKKKRRVAQEYMTTERPTY